MFNLKWGRESGPTTCSADRSDAVQLCYSLLRQSEFGCRNVFMQMRHR